MEIKLERLTQTQRMQGRRLRQEQMWAWGELKKYIFVDIEVKSNSHPLPQSFAVPIKVNECRLPSYCTIDVSWFDEEEISLDAHISIRPNVSHVCRSRAASQRICQPGKFSRRWHWSLWKCRPLWNVIIGYRKSVSLERVWSRLQTGSGAHTAEQSPALEAL